MSEISEQFDALGIAIAKLDSETPEAYQAFLAYAWLQGVDRTLKNVAEKTGFAHISCKMWSDDNNWKDRAAVIDGLRWKAEYEHRESIIRADNDKFIQQNREIKEQGIKIGKQMLAVAGNLLNSAELADEVIATDEIETKDGRIVPTYTTIKMKAKISDIPRLVDTAVKVTRLVQDLPTDIIEMDLPVNADLSKLSVEELIELRDKNQRKMREIAAEGKVETVSDASN